MIYVLLACLTSEKEEGFPVSIPFSAEVGGLPFACGQTYAGIGNPAVNIEALDFRLYLSDPVLIATDGTTVPLTLDQDRRWQYQNVALLDFEDGTAACETGSPELHTEITGTVPTEDDYVGFSFGVGLPPSLNHLDAATAPAPLNDTGLWWAWTSGYKFARIDVKTDENPSFFFHLGATSCAEKDKGEYACKLDNNPVIQLDDFEVGSDQVTMDLSTFYAGNDLNAPVDNVSDFVSGCMAFEGDPECVSLMGHFGLPWGDNSTAPAQTFFKVESL